MSIKPLENCVVMGDATVPRETLFNNASRVAAALKSMGVGENDRVALLLRNDINFIEIALAVNYVGAFSVPINWHMTTVEIKAVLDDCGASFVFCHADLYSTLLGALGEGHKAIIVPIPDSIKGTHESNADEANSVENSVAYSSLLDFLPLETEPLALRGNIIYTSGTTGQPKGVVREPATGDMALRSQEVIEKAYGIDRAGSIRAVVTGPMYHSVPNIYALTAVRRSGSFVVIQPRFDAEELLRFIEEYSISHLHLVPTMFVRLLKLPTSVRNRYDVSSLKFVAHGAAPCPSDVKQKMIEWWGPVIHEYYGASETGPAVVHGSQESLEKPGTVGKALPWSEIRILDKHGTDLSSHEEGEVYVRIEGYPRSTYLNRDDLNGNLREDGFVSAGDLGYVDDEGYLFLTGRASDMIVSGGVNIYPQEIEEAIQAVPGVLDSAVLGVPDNEFGERVCAFIQLDGGAELDASMVRAAISGSLARYKIPREIYFVDSLPREDSGKLKKRVIKDKYLSGGL